MYDSTNYQYPNSYTLAQQALYEPVNNHVSIVQGNLPSRRNRRQRNRRLFFNTGAFFNITRAFKSTIRSTVGKLLGPEFFFDGILGVSALPPIVVLPLAFLAFGLLLREEIGDVITDKFCKYFLTVDTSNVLLFYFFNYHLILLNFINFPFTILYSLTKFRQLRRPQ